MNQTSNETAHLNCMTGGWNALAEHLSLPLLRLTLDSVWGLVDRARMGPVTGCKEGIPTLFLKPHADLGAWTARAQTVWFEEHFNVTVGCGLSYRSTGLECPGIPKAFGHNTVRAVALVGTGLL